MTDLLPPSATKLERDLSDASDFLHRTAGAVPALRTAKRTDIPASVVPWLIVEYGLGELLPYLTDPRRAIAEGVLWQRIRGTPGALKTALSWIGFTADVEEAGTPGAARWADFQLGLDAAPADVAFVQRAVELARLSAPVRSKLTRIHGGYDRRKFVLSRSKLSGPGLLSDYSGTTLRPDWPVLSFGRLYAQAVDWGPPAAAGHRDRAHTVRSFHPTRFVLDAGHLDEGRHIRSPDVMHGRNNTLSNPGGDLAVPGSLTPFRRFAKAAVILSGRSKLGQVNTALPVTERTAAGRPFTLSGGTKLSENRQGWRFTPMNERFVRTTAVTAELPQDQAATGGVAERLTVLSVLPAKRWPTLSAKWPGVRADAVIHATARVIGSAAQGQFWTSANWRSGATWTATRDITGIIHVRDN